MTVTPANCRSPADRNWYHDSTGHPPRLPALKGNRRTDVVVIGGGFTGLSAALDLRMRGFGVILLETFEPGFGASGRNGGQICTGLNRDPGEMEAICGREDAARLWAMAEEAKTILSARLQDHRIDCDYSRGSLYAGMKPSHARRLADMHSGFEALGYPHTRLMDRAAIQTATGSPLYTHGLHDAGGGHLHPLKLVFGLVRACLDAGVDIYARSPVTRIETGQAPAAHTENACVQARFMVLAGNAHLAPDLATTITGRIMPVGTWILATEILPPALQASLLPGNEALCDMTNMVNYWRKTADGRILFGGGVDYRGREKPATHLGLRREMDRHLPDLRDVAIDCWWGGHIAVTMNRLPDFGRIGPATYYAHGFSGHGVALTGLAGRLLAEVISGQAERFDVFARIPHRSFPGGRGLRMPALVLAMLWYRLKDLL